MLAEFPQSVTDKSGRNHAVSPGGIIYVDDKKLVPLILKDGIPLTLLQRDLGAEFYAAAANAALADVAALKNVFDVAKRGGNIKREMERLAGRSDNILARQAASDIIEFSPLIEALNGASRWLPGSAKFNYRVSSHADLIHADARQIGVRAAFYYAGASEKLTYFLDERIDFNLMQHVLDGKLNGGEIAELMHKNWVNPKVGDIAFFKGRGALKRGTLDDAILNVTVHYVPEFTCEDVRFAGLCNM